MEKIMRERQIDSRPFNRIFGPEIHHDNFPGTPGYIFNPDTGDYEPISMQQSIESYVIAEDSSGPKDPRNDNTKLVSQSASTQKVIEKVLVGAR